MGPALCLMEAVQEGTCDETPFEGLCFPLSIRNWHFVKERCTRVFLRHPYAGAKSLG
jgi:hypothetical protein